MGFFDTQRAKVNARLQAAARLVLDEDEELRAGVFAIKAARVWPLVVGFIGLAVILSLNNLELRSWVIGGTIGAYMVMNNRNYYLLLTDRRLSLVRGGQLSTKKLTQERHVPLDDIARCELRDGLVNSNLLIEVNGGKEEKFRVGRPFKRDAERLVEQCEDRGGGARSSAG